VWLCVESSMKIVLKVVSLQEESAESAADMLRFRSELVAAPLLEQAEKVDDAESVARDLFPQLRQCQLWLLTAAMLRCRRFRRATTAANAAAVRRVDATAKSVLVRKWRATLCAAVSLPS
jgi:hypothetical protein